MVGVQLLCQFPASGRHGNAPWSEAHHACCAAAPGPKARALSGVAARRSSPPPGRFWGAPQALKAQLQSPHVVVGALQWLSRRGVAEWSIINTRWGALAR